MKLLNYDFKDENFDSTDFSSKCLIGIKFKNCSLRFCNFKNSDLSYAIFDSCDLYQADFSGSVLYTTRIIDSDATKTNFEYAYLNGFRVSNINVTHATFGHTFDTGIVRKNQDLIGAEDNWLICCLGESIDNIADVEIKYNGIYCESTSKAIRFINPDYENWRVWRRKSEIAKTIQKILEENGYRDMSLDYYYWYRIFLRRHILKKQQN